MSEVPLYSLYDNEATPGAIVAHPVIGAVDTASSCTMMVRLCLELLELVVRGIGAIRAIGYI